MAATCILHLAVDTDLSIAFDGLINATRTPASPVLFSPLPPRTRIRAERCVNAVAQTVVLTLPPSKQEGDSLNASAVEAGGDGDGAGVVVSPPERNIYAVALLDVQQVPPLLSTATAHRCPPHPSGAGPLGWYLDAIVDGLVEANANESDTLENNKDHSRRAGETHALRACSPSAVEPTNNTTTGSATPPLVVVVVHLSLIVVPNATSSLDGMNSTNGNISAKEAATLFSAAAAWSAGRQLLFSKKERPGTTSVDGSAVTVHWKSTRRVEEKMKGLEVTATLDLCTTAAQPQQAMQMIAALANKLLKNCSASTAGMRKDLESSANHNGATPLTAAAMDLKDVRPDTQRKCVPTDFHALYTSMLTEVSSFSERRTIATVAAFPTMCHLLEYIDSVTSQEEKKEADTTSPATGVSAASAAVYSTNFGEQRSWNVLNDAIVEAIITEYGPA